MSISYTENILNDDFERLSAAHGSLFKSIIEFNECKNILEIGVARATTTKYLCAAAQNTGGFVHGYDIFGTHGLQNQWSAFASKQQCESYLNHYGFDNYKLHQVDSKSDAFKELIKENHTTIDFAFIDGCHSYYGVENDFFAVYPYLSECGIVAFHDTQMIDGCREFILDLRTKFNDGTYDIIDFPFGNEIQRCGVTLLVKRSYPVLNLGLTESCGSPSTLEEIRERELKWYKSELKKNKKN